MKLFLQSCTNEKRTIKQMIARVKDRLAYGNLNPDQKEDFEAQKARLVKSGYWS